MKVLFLNYYSNCYKKQTNKKNKNKTQPTPRGTLVRSPITIIYRIFPFNLILNLGILCPSPTKLKQEQGILKNRQLDPM